MSHPPARPLAIAAAALALLALTSCAAPEPGAPASEPAPHGYVEGATELDEPQPQLVAVGPDGGITGIDLLSEERADLGRLEAPPERLTTDGRFVFALASGRVEIVDSGVWTQPHGDHSHYYRATPRVLGAVQSATDALPTAQSSGTRTAVLFPGSEVVLLDRDALGRGEVAELARFETAADVAAPIGDALLLADDEHGLRAADADGEQIGDVRHACPAPSGIRATRVGVVVGCADGAVLATESEGAVTLEHIPYPAEPVAPAAPAASEFASRNDRAATAGIAGDTGAWVLDTRARAWSHIATDRPLRAVTAVDDDEERVVAVDDAGHVLVLAADTGETLSTSPPMAARSLRDPASAERLTLAVDTDRAYLHLPATREVVELDYRDGARIARRFAVPAGALVVETGR